MLESTLHVWPPDADKAAVHFLTRRFGGASADLDIDFGATPRARVVTSLLGCCLCDRDGSAFNQETLWSWSVAARLQGLIAIAHATGGPLTTALATCKQGSCGERIELELTLNDFALSSPEHINWRTPQQQDARIRLPAGIDQLAWYQRHFERHDANSTWLARRLVTQLDRAPPPADWILPPAWLAPLGDALAAADPLTALTVTTHCPACAAELAIEVDLEYLLLEACRDVQRALLEEIHQLAYAYHWPEADIVALPPWRRAHYLSRIRAHS